MDASLRRRFNATVAFTIANNHDNSTTEYHLDARKQSNNKNIPATPDLQVTTSASTLQALLDTKLTPQQAFMKGKLKIKGKMGLAMKLKLVLDATRKHLANSTARL